MIYIALLNLSLGCWEYNIKLVVKISFSSFVSSELGGVPNAHEIRSLIATEL